MDANATQDTSAALEERLMVDELRVQVVVKTLNAEGMLVNERTLPAARIFRAKVPDVWALVDQEIARLQAKGEL